jgi:hypothetical protein
MKTSPRIANLWPYAILGWFVLVISFLATFATWAVQQNMDLVRADYYDEEIRYQQHLDRQQRTRGLAPGAAVGFEAAAQRIRVTLPAAHAARATGSIRLYRPSDARLDRERPLRLDPDGQQSLDARELPAGLWKVRVHWTTDGEEFFLEQPVITGGTPRSSPGQPPVAPVGKPAP